MRVGIIGTGAIAGKHAQVYRNIGYQVLLCTDRTDARGRSFAQTTGAKFVATPTEVCSHPDIDYVDVCTFPAYRLAAVELCARFHKHVLVQKPMAIDLETARQMISVANKAGIQLGVVSQHRFDDSILFLKSAIEAGRLGRILQADAYVKWFRSTEYYVRAGKGKWEVEGGGALISQAIHQVDLLLHLIGPVDEVTGHWQLGTLHKIESDDLLCALLHYASGATGVLQTSTALWPGYSERLEIHGTKGTAVVTGDQLTSWDVQSDSGDLAPVAARSASGASDLMAISLTPFERQFTDFGEACRTGRAPACSGIDGFRALHLVRGVYTSCAERRRVQIEPESFSALT